MRVLVTRPEPAATRTAARLRTAGHDVLVAPLLEPLAVPWVLPSTLPQAVIVTSATAVRLAGPHLAALLALPAYVVGAATADAVRAAGFAAVTTAGGTAAALFAHVAESGVTHALHLAGAERMAVAVPPTLRVDVAVVYAARLAEALPPAAVAALSASAPPLTLLYSPRTAARFAALVDAARIDRAHVTIAAISSATAAAAGVGWAAILAAATPTEAALLAAAGLVCDREADSREG